MTQDARQVVVQAQQEARGLAHDYVSSEHLLLGLLTVRDSVAGRALASMGLSLVLVRERVVQKVGSGERDSPEAIPFTPRAKRILALAGEDALTQGDDDIGTDHILLAVLREHEAVAAGILRDLEVDPEHLRRIVRATLPGPSSWPSTEAQIASPRAEKAATGTGGPRVTIREMQSETFPNARELAQAFGSAVCEPTWWPADTEHISYRLVRGSGPAHYEIGGTRHGAIPICVVGHAEADLNGRSPRDWLSGEWSAPPELADLRGAIGAVGTPRRLQAVIYSCGLQIQLIGYDTEQEIIRAVDSLRQTGTTTTPP